MELARAAIAFGLPEMVIPPGKLNKEELSCMAQQFRDFKAGQHFVHRREGRFLDFEGVVEVPAEYGLGQ